MASVDGGTDAAEDCDAQRTAELGASLGDARRRPGPLGWGASDNQVSREGSYRGGAQGEDRGANYEDRQSGARLLAAFAIGILAAGNHFYG